MLSDDKGYFWVLYLIYVGIVVIQVRLFVTVAFDAHQPYSCVEGVQLGASAKGVPFGPSV